MVRERLDILALPLADVRATMAGIVTLMNDGTYDGFVQRHMNAMMVPMPAGSQANQAHRGPIFLPWHRASLWEFETRWLATPAVSARPSLTGFPYWRWESEAALNGGAPRLSKVWTNDYFGGDGVATSQNRVLDGPFTAWKAWLYSSTNKTYYRRGVTGVVRKIGRDSAGVPTLPDQAQVNDTFTFTRYDVAPYSYDSQSFRGRMEGWAGGVRMHNQVHRWVGGDMVVGTSPNDPVFWFHHANVDRLWWRWQIRSTPIRPYQRTGDGYPEGHRPTDVMQGLLNAAGPWTPAMVEDIRLAPLGYSYLQ